MFAFGGKADMRKSSGSFAMLTAILCECRQLPDSAQGYTFRVGPSVLAGRR
jgi:hypothetical protein